jgi:RHS repeat-associated protein
MLTEVDAKSQTTSYTYDTLNRVTRIDYQGGAYVTYTYDDNGNLTQMYESANGTTSYTYDYRNRVTLKTFPDATTVSYTYDGDNNLTSKTDTGGTVSYAYNVVNLLSTVTEPGSYVTQYTSYDGSGNLLSMTYPNSVVVMNSWDVANRLTLTQTNLGETTLTKFSYTYYDPTTGRDTNLRQTIVDKNNYTTTYTYDKLNELTSAIKKDSGGNTLDSRSWTYNENSNRTQQIINSATTNYTYDNNNRILTAGTLSYTWDNNGNLLSRSDGLTLTYDSKDFTASITPPGGSAISMNYTGTDQTQRIQKGSTTYKYDDKAIGPAVQTSGGTSTYFTTTPSGGLVSLRQGTNRYYYIFDGLGSVVGLTNLSGTVVNTYSYDPYGVILSQTEGVVQQYKFAGVYYDSETGLYKMGARYYDPTIGRFTQVDLLQIKSGLPIVFNCYIYSGNNPVNGTDITGYLAPIVIIFLICMAIGYAYIKLWYEPQRELKQDLEKLKNNKSQPKIRRIVPPQDSIFWKPDPAIEGIGDFTIDKPEPRRIEMGPID